MMKRTEPQKVKILKMRRTIVRGPETGLIQYTIDEPKDRMVVISWEYVDKLRAENAIMLKALDWYRGMWSTKGSGTKSGTPKNAAPQKRSQPAEKAKKKGPTGETRWPKSREEAAPKKQRKQAVTGTEPARKRRKVQNGAARR